jgi:hypothetical protein
VYFGNEMGILNTLRYVNVQLRQRRGPLYNLASLHGAIAEPETLHDPVSPTIILDGLRNSLPHGNAIPPLPCGVGDCEPHYPRLVALTMQNPALCCGRRRFGVFVAPCLRPA